jgi:hypothetical protein
VSKAGKALTVSIILASLLGVVVVLVTMRTDDAERKVEDSARLLDKFRALPYAMVGDEDVDSAKSGVLFHDPSKSVPTMMSRSCRTAASTRSPPKRYDIAVSW